MKKNKRAAKQKKAPRYRWVLDVPRETKTSGPVAGKRYPMEPPKLDAFDELAGQWESYKERMDAVLEQYWEDIVLRAHGPAYSDIRTRALFGGLEPCTATRKSSLGDPLVWVVQHQVLGWSFKRIAAGNQRKTNQRKNKDSPSEGHVGETVRVLATAMGLILRPTQGRTDGKNTSPGFSLSP